MKPFNILPGLTLKGRIILPGDKSIAHRALILGAISSGVTTLDNFPENNDLAATLDTFLRLGVKIKKGKKGKVIIFGKGLNGLQKPQGSLFVAESGTTFRLLLGLLAAQEFGVKLTAGKSLSKRPMLRVIQPLRKMGAFIKSRRSGVDEYPPVFIKGGNLKGITYKIPVASAQVKSAIILAGLYAQGQTKVIEIVQTRDHTERMLKVFKAKIKHEGNAIVIEKRRALISPGGIYIPGDLSSAAFFMVAVIILSGSEILLKDISLNPSRLGVVRVLKRMGAHINIVGRHVGMNLSGFEPLGDIAVRSSELKATRVRRREVPSLIDELPILMVASCFARGETVLEGVKELRVKEADRVSSMLENLRRMGADIRVARSNRTENIIIKGVGKLKGASLRSFGDHRTAMSAIIAGLAASGKSRIDDVSCINKSFPGFVNLLMSLQG